MRRRGPNPVVVLVVLAVVPALGLGAVSRMARSQADEQVQVVPASSVPVTAPPAALATPLVSVRRAPTPLQSDRRADVVTASADSVTASVDATSCLAVGLDDRTLVTVNPDAEVIPASDLKVAVAAVAAEVLGLDHVFTTTVVGPAPVNGTVEGNLYLVGGGDPVLAESWYTEATTARKRPPFNTTDIAALADAVVATGVRAVIGGVVGDDSRYDAERYPEGWSADIRSSTDGAPVGALTVNDSFDKARGQSTDPGRSAAQVLARLLKERGVTIGTDSATGTAPAGGTVLATVTSQPLPAILNEMLATSDNLTAEMLLKELAVETGQPGTRAAGAKVVMDRLVQWGVPMVGVNVVDGSGLSRENHFTCAAVMAVLQHGSASDAVGAGMARAGQDGTTLVGRFPQEGLTGVLQAKTGSLTGVKALCGYLPIGTDELAFVLVLNGASASNFETIWGHLADLLLASLDVPSVEAFGPR